MNKSDLMMALKENVNLSRQEAENIVNVFFQSIEDSLGSGGRVEIRGFGSFTVNGYKSYVGRNPKTGERIRVPSKKLPFFKVGKELKEMVDISD
ncbi:MAG: integration host factor subunit beta [Desulfobacteraceae bacterium]|jgi:integration host factor subunit beta|nr:integration host factor subunit beta [Desulfobacteraceae bacterium]MBC2750514.1 integration host factor subunit beta [Desulfobacteraceae bacterium]MCB2166857.1 integration host factor subunit beta [Deltaproteobacteria bacterium]